MGQMGKLLWQCTTTGLDNSIELRMEKIRQVVTEIWVPQVWQPPARPPEPWRQYPSSPKGWGVKSNLPVQGVAGLTRCFILLPWEPLDDGRSKEKSLIIHGSGTTHRRCVNVIPSNQINTSLGAIDNGRNTDSSLTHYGLVVLYRNIDLGQHWLR